MKDIFKQLKTAFIVAIAMFVICGFMYPMVLTGVASLIFPYQANGSLIKINNEIVGSKLVGQDFTDERLFHCRPSAVNYNTYNEEDVNDGTYSGVASGSNNYGVSNPALKERLNKDVEKFLVENPTIKVEDIPSDIITASGSGLDPHISIDAAKVQVDRIVSNTGLIKDDVLSLIDEHTEKKLLGLFGEDKVNVLELNLDLIKLIEF